MTIGGYRWDYDLIKGTELHTSILLLQVFWRKIILLQSILTVFGFSTTIDLIYCPIIASFCPKWSYV